MKKANGFTGHRVAPGEIRSFVKIAVSTCESEVLTGCLTTMLPGDDMLDMERSIGLVLGK